MKTREEIIAIGDFQRFEITADQLQPSGPVDPMGWNIEWTLEQWAEMWSAYQRGESVFGAAPIPVNPYRAKASELLADPTTPIAARKALYKVGETESEIQGAFTEMVRLANGETVEIIKDGGIGLQRTRQDDPALNRAPIWGSFTVKIF